MVVRMQHSTIVLARIAYLNLLLLYLLLVLLELEHTPFRLTDKVILPVIRIFVSNVLAPKYICRSHMAAHFIGNLLQPLSTIVDRISGTLVKARRTRIVCCAVLEQLGQTEALYLLLWRLG
jgi:hypothetical protein